MFFRFASRGAIERSPGHFLTPPKKNSFIQMNTDLIKQYFLFVIQRIPNLYAYEIVQLTLYLELKNREIFY